MRQTIRDVMTPDPVTLPATTPLEEAARCMRDREIGDVLVSDDGSLCGVVTDRDIVVRGLADGRASARLGDICSRDLVSLSPDDGVDEAVRLMRQRRAIRRLPIVENGRAVGLVSIGDLAIERDADSALADISAAAPNS
jgi:CBS domain-containing protein